MTSGSKLPLSLTFGYSVTHRRWVLDDAYGDRGQIDGDIRDARSRWERLLCRPKRLEVVLRTRGVVWQEEIDEARSYMERMLWRVDLEAEPWREVSVKPPVAWSLPEIGCRRCGLSQEKHPVACDQFQALVPMPKVKPPRPDGPPPPLKETILEKGG